MQEPLLTSSPKVGGIKFKRTLKGAPKRPKQHEVIVISDDDDDDNQIECDTNTNSNDSNEVTSSSSSSSGYSNSNSNTSDCINKCNPEKEDINAYWKAHSELGMHCNAIDNNSSSPLRGQARQIDAHNWPPRRKSCRGATQKPLLYYKELRHNYKTNRKLFEDYVDRMRKESQRQILARHNIAEDLFTN